MSTLLYRDARFAAHEVPPGHPERPARLAAVDAGIVASNLTGNLVDVEPRLATLDDLARVHDPTYLDQLAAFCAGGGGRLDPDTSAVAASFDIARLAAGAGLDAADRLRAGEADAAFCAVRPPGHHATPSRAMGFCLLNNVAVTAASLALGGARVLIVDIDAHHGNGTQEAFYGSGQVAFVSLHESPMYPYTGALDDTGTGAGAGTTCNIPLPAGATGDVYRRAIDEVVVPFAERFGPDWLLVSLGFDAHRADPLTGLGLSSADFGDLLGRLVTLVPQARPIVFLEGGYDLDAVRDSTAASLRALAGLDGTDGPEPVTGAGPGDEAVRAAAGVHGF